MLQISRMADYAIVLTTHIARNPDTIHTAPSAAEATNLGEATVSKLLKMLAKSGILASTRGARGGYSLGRSATSITMANVVEAIDGPLALVWCVQSDSARSKECPVSCSCTAQRHWARINAALQHAMQGTTIADLMVSHTPLPALSTMVPAATQA